MTAERFNIHNADINMDLDLKFENGGIEHEKIN